MDRFTLCMDRANGTHSSNNVNYLVVSIAWQGASIPIVWECLDKKGGNSNTDERIAVMECVLNLMPIKRIGNLLADREFNYVLRDAFTAGGQLQVGGIMFIYERSLIYLFYMDIHYFMDATLSQYLFLFHSTHCI
ncbi:MAG: hypothetical protein QS721_09845 [Candidatus Endonucleobacter sp. (ex Gigantidas childressi)]|nr:hypothetical protein [Candidatus Endonucleobacter sp. (ex Gigantidas childressi)]